MLKRNFKKLLIIFVVALFVALIFAVQRYYLAKLNHQPILLWQIIYSDFGGRLISFAYVPVIFLLIERYRPEKYGWLRVVLIHIPSGILFALLSIGAFDFFGKLVYPAFGTQYQTSMPALYLPRVYSRLVFYTVLVIVCSAIDYYQRYQKEVLSQSQLEALLARAQLESLKVKLDPEFLFGALRSISILMHKDMEAADRMTARLGDFLRSTLEGSMNETMSLKQELDSLSCYLEIEKLGCQNGLHIHFNTGSGTLDTQVPSRLIHMIVGELLGPRESTSKSRTIEVHCTRMDRELQIDICRKLASGEAHPKLDPSWMNGVEARLDQVYGKDYRIVVSEFGSSNCSIRILIPAQTQTPSTLLGDFASGELRPDSAGDYIYTIYTRPDREASKKTQDRSFWMKGLMVAGLWTAIALLNSLMDIAASLQTGEAIRWREFGWSYLGWYFWAALTPFILCLVRKFPMRSPHVGRSIAVYAAVSIGLISILITIYTLVYWQVDASMQTFSQSMRMVITSFGFAFDLFLYWIIVAVGNQMEFNRNFQKEQLKAAKLENQLASAQLQALQMQLHPHFLFNTLNSISELIHENRELAEKMLVKLEAFLKLTLESSAAQEVPLETELDFLRHYLEIEQIRFQNRLNVKMLIEPSTMRIPVPNLILQPIVENAIRHGISRQSAPGQLEIQTSLARGMLHVQVRDNGRGILSGIREGQIREGLGISNTKARLRQMYGSHHRLEMHNVLEGGFIVTMDIPTLEGVQ